MIIAVDFICFYYGKPGFMNTFGSQTKGEIKNAY